MCCGRCPIGVFSHLRIAVGQSVATDEHRRRHRDEWENHDSMVDSQSCSNDQDIVWFAGHRRVLRRHSDRIIEFDDARFQVAGAVAWPYGCKPVRSMLQSNCRVMPCIRDDRPESNSKRPSSQTSLRTISIITRRSKPIVNAKSRILELIRPGGLIALNIEDRGAWSLRDRVCQSLKLCFIRLESRRPTSPPRFETNH